SVRRLKGQSHPGIGGQFRREFLSSAHRQMPSEALRSVRACHPVAMRPIADPVTRYRQINLARAKRVAEHDNQTRCRDLELPGVSGFGSEDPTRRSRDNI